MSSNLVGGALNSLVSEGFLFSRLVAAPKRLCDGVSLLLPVHMDVACGGLHRLVAGKLLDDRNVSGSVRQCRAEGMAKRVHMIASEL